MDVPEDFRSRYVERRKQDLEICRSSLAQQNFREIEKVAHKLKGNGDTFGYSELTSIGRVMEGAAVNRNIDQLKKTLEDFSQWVHGHLN